MRGLQLSLNKGQKLRLERALEQLESLSSRANSDASVIVADDISVNHEDAILKYYRLMNSCFCSVFVYLLEFVRNGVYMD